MGPLEANKAWSMSGVRRCYRFLRALEAGNAGTIRKENGELSIPGDSGPTSRERRVPPREIKKVSEIANLYRFTTAIAQMIIIVNELLTIAENPPHRGDQNLRFCCILSAASLEEETVAGRRTGKEFASSAGLPAGTMAGMDEQLHREDGKLR